MECSAQNDLTRLGWINLLVSNLRRGGFKVHPSKKVAGQISQQYHDLTMAVVDRYYGTSISDRFGKMNVKPIRLEYEQKFQPVQPPCYTIHYH